MPKLAICLQVSPLDVWAGLRLVKLICAIEPKKRDDIEFIVSARRDTNAPAVNDIIVTARSKFANVNWIKGKRFGTGWPQGCNDLWQETMMRASMLYDTGRIKSDGILTFEADCIPLRADWLDCLAEAWARGKAMGKECVGHAHCWPLEDAPERAGEPGHINGNAIFNISITDHYPALNGSDARMGWDCSHATLLLSVGTDTPMIHQKYRIKNISRQQIEAIRKDGQIPALFHGIKGTDGLDAIEAMVADGTFFRDRSQDIRNCIVMAHTGGGLFSLINKVISAGQHYNGEIHVNWSENCMYGTPGRNAWNDLFAKTAPPPPEQPFEVVNYYPDYSLTFRYAAELYTPTAKNIGWREQCNAIWKRLQVSPELEKAALHFITDEMPEGFIGVMVRSRVQGAEQPSQRSQELDEYAAEVAARIEDHENLFVMAADQETINWFEANFPDRTVYHSGLKRVSSRESVERHTSGQCDIEDAKLCLIEILIMSQARLMIHPCSNMATAALYINPDLVSVYLP